MWDAMVGFMPPTGPTLATDFWSVLFNFNELLEVGPDAAIYLALAVVGTLIFLLRLAAALFLGVDSDIDVDFDGDMDVGHGAGYGLISLFSITAFIMGAGWAGLAARVEWGLGTVAASFAAGGIGFAFMLMASGIMFIMRRAVHEVKIDPRSALGKTAMVYQNIPEQGKGAGKVRVTVTGQSTIARAISTGPAIASFAAVKVLDVRDDGTFIVEPSGQA